MKNVCLSLLLTCLLVNTQAQEVTEQQKISNMVSFAKLYGYVRYFHPADEAANTNWNQFLLYGIKHVEDAANTAELNDRLTELFYPIAPTIIVQPSSRLKKVNKNSMTPPNQANYKQISWQHFGFGTEGPLYKSIRINRPVKIVQNNKVGFGPASNRVDVKPYRGLKFKMSAFMKTEVTTGLGQLFARVDLDNQRVGFFDNMQDRPVTSNEWKSYEISGVIDTNATNLVFGGFLIGDGRIWLNDFKIEVFKDGAWSPLQLGDSWALPKSEYTGKIDESNKFSNGSPSLLIERLPKTEIAKPIFDIAPKFGDCFVGSIGNGLFCAIPLVLMGDAENTFPISDSGKLAALRRKISNVEIKTADKYTALSGVIYAWNVFQHFFPYREEESKSDWENQLPKSLMLASEVKSIADYGDVLRSLTEKLNDGHISIYGFPEDYYAIQADAALVENKLIFTELSPISEKAGLKLGDELISIDGVSAMEKYNKFKSRISGSEQWKNAIAPSGLFRGAKDTNAQLIVKSEGASARSINIDRADFRKKVDTVTIKKLDDGIFYINIGDTEMSKIDKLMPELSKAKGIICDLRGYPKGNHDLISHLLTVKDKNKWMFVPQISYPDYAKVTYSASGWEMRPKQPHIGAKIVFITGGYSISYAESYMGFIKHYKLATIVGGPTAGANGNVNTFEVPGGYKIRFTGMNVKLQDGGQLFRLGIQPDVIVNPTIKGIREGRDEQLEKALSIVKESTGG